MGNLAMKLITIALFMINQIITARVMNINCCKFAVLTRLNKNILMFRIMLYTLSYWRNNVPWSAANIHTLKCAAVCARSLIKQYS